MADFRSWNYHWPGSILSPLQFSHTPGFFSKNILKSRLLDVLNRLMFSKHCFVHLCLFFQRFTSLFSVIIARQWHQTCV
jgi:hypothetical protein